MAVSREGTKEPHEAEMDKKRRTQRTEGRGGTWPRTTQQQRHRCCYPLQAAEGGGGGRREREQTHLRLGLATDFRVRSRKKGDEEVQKDDPHDCQERHHQANSSRAVPVGRGGAGAGNGVSLPHHAKCNMQRYSRKLKINKLTTNCILWSTRNPPTCVFLGYLFVPPSFIPLTASR